MQAIWQSFFLVFVSEMGDKTQLLALVLAARFKKPWTIMAGILVATLLNHALASWVGQRLSGLVNPTYLSWILAATFFAFAIWILIPDKDEELKQKNKYGAFLTTLVTFFLAEMGDKTQLATVALGAQFQDFYMVTIGTTLGMLGADGLAVFFGKKLTAKIPMNIIHKVASFLFFLFGIALLMDWNK
jgi:putative Ca2+/H+ antiporter (TMEM165/GDT1 family)